MSGITYINTVDHYRELKFIANAFGITFARSASDSSGLGHLNTKLLIIWPPSPQRHAIDRLMESLNADRHKWSSFPRIDLPPTVVVDNTDPADERELDHSTRQLSPRFLAPSTSMASDNQAVDMTSTAASHNPFNFKTQSMQNIGQRRGHRYKHSSISAQHQIFQEPPPRPPPVLPASLPIPTLAEAWNSMHKEQRTRLYWSMCHLTVAIFIFFRSEGSLSAMALSHLVFFDAGSAAVCVVVEVLGNFEVWRRSSIRHPFGLERAEVLAGFAMSIFLLFGGFDLVSHNLKHVLETMGDHEAHHEHEHGHVSASSIDLVAAVAIISTLISAYGLKNHSRIAKVMRVSYLAALPSVLSNPFHFLTLLFSVVVALLPLLSISLYTWLDRLICAAIAVAMFGLGMRVVIAQGLMLLMSYGGANGNSEVTTLLRDIESDTTVTRVEESQFWQVHYGLCMANLKVSIVRGCDEMAISKLRNRVSSLIQNRLGEGYGAGGNIRWEVTLQIHSDTSS
ncbi:Endoplasmic reticulum zinc transporter [Metarhizium rileyi]|uniref:Zinc transporter n=1 Tax=Metarhizium rileyi (strain RCEF 4871) TaxID=1649241 RepID=A0A5C6GIQ0_METRR|nr:Endoplasmic reticulum zinc transporter [Metarhizium rileyi]